MTYQLTRREQRLGRDRLRKAERDPLGLAMEDPSLYEEERRRFEDQQEELRRRIAANRGLLHGLFEIVHKPAVFLGGTDHQEFGRNELIFENEHPRRGLAAATPDQQVYVGSHPVAGHAFVAAGSDYSNALVRLVHGLPRDTAVAARTGRPISGERFLHQFHYPDSRPKVNAYYTGRLIQESWRSIENAATGDELWEPQLWTPGTARDPRDAGFPRRDLLTVTVIRLRGSVYVFLAGMFGAATNYVPAFFATTGILRDLTDLAQRMSPQGSFNAVLQTGEIKLDHTQRTMVPADDLGILGFEAVTELDDGFAAAFNLPELAANRVYELQEIEARLWSLREDAIRLARSASAV